ncbi:GGDEF domain-containing protein [Acidicapsa ligni]|uniref:GGDEF domain-containing protein n=1 Tax=Acidicapsa ligni TaxID=542300 RepID=UPI0021E00349|nr:GGDEF domain-containing protein [Acidicapsa ligni]
MHRTVAIILLAFATHWVHAKQTSRKNATAAPLMIEALGKGTFALSGPWQFHTGDDPTWANPTFDSSGWEKLSADQPWGKQGHANLTGFAWYRCSIALTQAPGVPQEFSLLVPKIRDPYEIYWNGSLIGHNGKLPPSPVWYISQPMQTFELGQVQHGVLAVRVWKAPLLSDDSGEFGGFDTAPLIGSPEAIATVKAAYEFQWLRSRQLHFGANLLCAVIAFLSFLLWLRASDRWVLFWTAGFAVAQPAILLLVNAHLGLPYSLAMGAAEPLSGMQDISLWFLLLWLLSLHENRVICRITRIFAYIYIVSEVLDGVLIALSGNPQWTSLAQISDAVLAIFSFLFELFPLVLVGYALFQRKQFDSARWLVAILAFLDDMLLVFSYTVKQGRQFTGWAIADKIDSPLFSLDGNGISLRTLAGALLLVAIVYAVYHSVREDQHRQDALELEKMELLHESNRMRHHAEHDGLTGLWNHRVIVERLSQEMIRSRRDGTPMSVILADVDHFKKVNDSYGHLAGDIVLKEIGTVLSRSLRPYDCVGRYGGEEFLLILPNCGMESALIRGEQLRVAVQSARIQDGETLLQVTASFGVASVLRTHHEAEAIIRAVDAALYRAKSCGRNCVISAEAEMDASICNF